MRVRWLGASVAVGVLLAGFVTAQEKSAPKGKKSAAVPDEQAAMAAMQKAATPGEAHQKLNAVVGNFDAKIKLWMDPSKPPEESTGTSENTWVLGNRYVEMKYQGTFMGQPFSGIGYQGYDNVTKRYVGTWMDTAGTGMMSSTGTMTGNVMKTTGTVADPVSGKMEKVSSTLTIADNDHHTMEMWGSAPNGKPYKMMEIEYIRKP